MDNECRGIFVMKFNNTGNNSFFENMVNISSHYSYENDFADYKLHLNALNV